MRKSLSLSIALAAGALLAPSTLVAQEPVQGLRDLVGARGSSGESQLNGRGYTFVRTEKAGDSAFSYWREPQSGRCVAVRTTDGRYASIVYAPDSDCGGGSATQLPATAPQTEDDFETVCGVETGGQVFRYRCRLRVEGCKGEGFCRSVITMPDVAYTITWLKNDEIDVTFEGTNPKRSKSSFENGMTRFALDGKTYFVYRSPDRARRELANLR